MALTENAVKGAMELLQTSETISSRICGRYRLPGYEWRVFGKPIHGQKSLEVIGTDMLLT
jgi:hypothetical protein